MDRKIYLLPYENVFQGHLVMLQRQKILTRNTLCWYKLPDMERDKPDLSGRVNGLDIGIFRRGQGLEISVSDATGQEVVLFRYSPQAARSEIPAFPPAPALSSAPTPIPEPASQPQSEVRTPVKIDGTIENIEGLGQTPTSGDPVFRFTVKVVNQQTRQEEVKQIAAFRQIGLKLHELASSSDPNIKLQPGRSISMMAWDHVATTGSYYPSSVNYLTFPPITNPKTQKRR